MSTASSYSTVVQELYVAYFGRPADYFGLQNFEAALSAANAPTDLAHLNAAYNTNAAIKTLIDSFGSSAESQSFYGSISGNADAFVNAVFENLFGRTAQPAGLSFWSNAITSGALTPGDAALAIAAGAAGNTTAQGMIDATTMANKVTVATDFTTLLGQNDFDITGYVGGNAVAIGRTLLAGVTATNLATYVADVPWAVWAIDGQHVTNYTLTTGIDDIAPGRGWHTISAILDNAAGLAAGGPAATLNPGDTITGDTQLFSVNTLLIDDFGLGANLALPASATISGINSLDIASLEGVAAADAPGGSLDFSTWAGLNSVDVNASTGVDNITAPANATVNVTDTAGDVIIHGGASINAKTDAASVIAIIGGTATTSVNLSGGGSPGATLLGDTTDIYGNSIVDAHFGSGTPNTIASVSLEGNGSTTIESDALTSLTLTGAANDVAFNAFVFAAAGTRTLALNLLGFNGGSVIDDTATTVNVTASYRDTATLNLVTNAATTVNFVAAVNMQLSGFSVPQASTVTISGNGAFTADLSQVNSATRIDATGAGGTNGIDLTFGAGAADTLSFGSHTAADQVTIGAVAASGIAPNLAHLLTIAGLNNAAQDSIVFADGASASGANFQQVGSAQVTASGGTPASLAAWVAAATGLGGIVQQSAHGVVEFQFGGNTYLIETATATDAGAISAQDAVVELVGSGYTFAHGATINGGVLHLLG